MNDLDIETDAPLLGEILGAPANALVVIPKAELMFVPGGAQKTLDSILAKARADAAKLDVSRPADRDAMRSIAYKLRRLQTAADKSGKELKEQYQKQIDPIDAERRAFREGMDAGIAEIIAPAEEFDAREAARIKGHEDAIADIASFGLLEGNLSSAALTRLLDDLNHLHVTREWFEFADRAASARTNARNALRLALIAVEAREKAEAEAKRLAEEEAARAQHEADMKRIAREAEIARQAAAAATLAAETAGADEAARVAAEVAEREAAAEADRLRIIRENEEAEARAAAALLAEQQEKQAAEERATKLREAWEANRVAEHRHQIACITERWKFGYDASSAAIIGSLKDPWLDRDFEEFSDEAREAMVATAIRLNHKLEEAQLREAAEAERQKKLAADKAEALRLAAIKEEQDRVEGLRIQQEAETRRRGASISHQRKINRAAVDDLVMHASLTTEQAEAVVKALAKKQIRYCKGEY